MSRYSLYCFPSAFPPLTRADVHDVVERVHALDDVHNQVREADIVLQDQWVHRLWLDHVVHEVEPLGVLQAALRQTLIGTFVVNCATLGRGGTGWCEGPGPDARGREGRGGEGSFLTWKLGMGFAVGSQVERGFSWERKGPLKARVMALRLKAHTADAAMLLLHGETETREKLKTAPRGAGKDGGRRRNTKEYIWRTNKGKSDVNQWFRE